MARSKGSRLKDVHRAFLVREMACHATPKEAADRLKEVYGIDISPQGAQHYDPTKHDGRTLAKHWVELFESSRKAFMEHVESQVPEANKAVRIKELALSARAFKARGNHVGKADMLERIAKEMGNVHTNKREHSGPGGKPIELDVMYAELTDEQLEARLKAALTPVAHSGVSPADGE